MEPDLPGDEPGRGDRPSVPAQVPVPAQPLSDSALLETLVLEAPVAFAFYDTDLRYRRINRMLADINGLPMADHVGRRPTEVLPPELGRAVEARLREVLDSGRVIVDHDFTAEPPTAHELRHYETQWFPASRDGEIIGVAVLVIDITERRRNEDALRRSTERTARLQRATAALAEALTVEQVSSVMAEIGREALGARRTRVVVDRARQLPGHRVDVEGDVRRVALPLVVSGGTIGELQLELDAPAEPEDATFLGALAGQCAIAVERARLYERERATAVALQQSLLPDRLPDVPGLELAARFLAGSPDAEVGGDWYDAFTLPDGRAVLVVGDVMGKGLNAAAGMGRLRSAVRALAHANPLPEAVLQGLDRVFVATEAEDQIATLVYLLLHPAARRVALGGAGHLPLVLRRAGAAPELVDAGDGATPLGWSEPRSQRTLELGPGDLLMAFTDGLVERRGWDIDTGLDQVLDAAAEPIADLDALVEQVTQTLIASTPGRDDATLLAVRFRT